MGNMLDVEIPIVVHTRYWEICMGNRNMGIAYSEVSIWGCTYLFTTSWNGM